MSKLIDNSVFTPEQKALWLEELRNGRNIQARRQLRKYKDANKTIVIGRCCLAVCMDKVINKTELGQLLDTNSWTKLVCMNDGRVYSTDDKPDEIVKEYSFLEIADWIEANVSTIDD